MVPTPDSGARPRFPILLVAFVALVAALVTGSSVAFGGPRAVAPSGGSATAGVVVVNTSLGYGTSAAGTGIVLTSSGEVLTNNHVIRGATGIRVADVSTGRTYTATVAGYSVSKDVALLRLRNARGLQTATFGNSSTIAVGDRVTAVGNSGGTGSLSTKSGTVTGLRQAITVSDDAGGTSRLAGLIETNAPLRPGDSGGPLVSNGRVIGIDAAASSSLRFRSGGGEGFAIPINAALKIAKQVDAGQASASLHVGPTAFLGVSLGESGPFGQDVTGAIVQAVVPGSPADRAGLAAGDVIVAFDGHRVSSPAKLRNLVLGLAPGRTVQLTWVDQVTGTSRATVRLVSGPPQ